MLVLVVLSITAITQISAQSGNIIVVHGKASLVGIVNVRNLPYSNEGLSNGYIQTTLGLVSPIGPGVLPTASPSSVSNTSTVSSTVGFDAINQAQSGGWTPPDGGVVAAGPNHLLYFVNVLGSIYTKQGALLQTINSYQFFKAPANDVPVDPKVLYDSSSGRFFASSINAALPSFTSGNVSIAVSTSSDPTGTWNVYNISPGAGILPDQPIIGVSDGQFIVSVNDFYGASGAQYWVINKSEMVSGASNLDFVSFGPNGSQFSVHPVQSLSSTAIEYMVSTGSNTVTLFAVSGVPPGSVSVNTVSLSISPLANPPLSIQKGTSTLLDSSRSGNRVLEAAWLQGRLWFSANDGCTPPGDSQQRSCVRLTQIDTSANSILQDFDLGSTGQYYFYPALRMDGNGNLDVIYGFSSANDYPSLAITGQASSDPSGSLAPSVTIKTGVAPNTSGRYGDYFGAGLDPSDPTTVWVSGEYGNQTNGAWATWIANMKVQSVAADFSITASPTSLTVARRHSTTSTITLTSLNGFSGTVSLAVSVYANPGDCTPPSDPCFVSNPPTATLSPNSVTLVSGTMATSTLTVTTTGRTTTGSYYVIVTGTSGTHSHQVSITLTVT